MSIVAEANSRLLIIGVGSPFGADQVGWRVAECLARSGTLRSASEMTWEVLIRDRPGVGLLNDLRGIERAVVIDAMRSNRETGWVQRFTTEDVIDHGGVCSSHGFGVGEALSLGRVLGELPEELSIFGVEIPAGGGVLSDGDFEAMAQRAAKMIERQLRKQD